MPHITVKMFTGRSIEKKKELAAALQQTMIRVLECGSEHVSVALEDWKPEDWHMVYENDIDKNPNLMIRPTYELSDIEKG